MSDKPQKTDRGSSSGLNYFASWFSYQSWAEYFNPENQPIQSCRTQSTQPTDKPCFNFEPSTSSRSSMICANCLFHKFNHTGKGIIRQKQVFSHKHPSSQIVVWDRKTKGHWLVISSQYSTSWFNPEILLPKKEQTNPIHKLQYTKPYISAFPFSEDQLVYLLAQGLTFQLCNFKNGDESSFDLPSQARGQKIFYWKSQEQVVIAGDKGEIIFLEYRSNTNQFKHKYTLTQVGQAKRFQECFGFLFVITNSSEPTVFISPTIHLKFWELLQQNGIDRHIASFWQQKHLTCICEYAGKKVIACTVAEVFLMDTKFEVLKKIQIPGVVDATVFKHWIYVATNFKLYLLNQRGEQLQSIDFPVSIFNLAVWNNLLCVSLIDSTTRIFEGLPNFWSPFNHHTHHPVVKDAIKTIMLMAQSNPTTGEPWHPESLWYLVPRDILYCIFNIIAVSGFSFVNAHNTDDQFVETRILKPP